MTDEVTLPKYCPLCGHRLIYTALTSLPSISVIKCGGCGWEIMEKFWRASDWCPDARSKEEEK